MTRSGQTPDRLRISFTTKAWNFHDVDSECVDAVAEAAKLCESLGHHLEEASPEFDEIARGKAVGIIADSQTRVLLGRAATSEDVETVTWEIAEYARRFSGSDYAEAINAVHGTGRVVGRFFTSYDMVKNAQRSKTVKVLSSVSVSASPPIGGGFFCWSAAGVHGGFEDEAEWIAELSRGSRKRWQRRELAKLTVNREPFTAILTLHYSVRGQPAIVVDAFHQERISNKRR
jgi:hypothetical protein